MLPDQFELRRSVYHFANPNFAPEDRKARFTVCVKTRCWQLPAWTPASVGVTSLDSQCLFHRGHSREACPREGEERESTSSTKPLKP